MTSGQTTSGRLVAMGMNIIRRLTGSHGDGKDVTDPRDIYTILSQADAKRTKTSQNSNILSDNRLYPRLPKDMNIKIESYKNTGRHTQISSSVMGYRGRSPEPNEVNKRDLPKPTILRHSSSLENLSTLRKSGNINSTLPQENDTHRSLPQIRQRKPKVTFREDTQQTDTIKNTAEDNTDTQDKTPNSVLLPKVPKVVKKTVSVEARRKDIQTNTKKNHHDESNPELENWFSVMPDEMFERANRILMEETIREKLRARGLGLDRTKTLFPKIQRRSPDLRAYEKYPCQYWELRAETVHDHHDLEIDMIDRDLYRLQQKSILKLKAVDREYRDKHNKAKNNVSPAPGQQDAQRHSKARKRGNFKGRMESFDSEDHGGYTAHFDLNPMAQVMLGPVPGKKDGMITGFDSLVAPSDSRKSKSRMKVPYFLTEEVGINPRKDKSGEVYKMERTTKVKSAPPTAVVNLRLDNEAPKKRNPKHIEESLEKQKDSSEKAEVPEVRPLENNRVMEDHNKDNDQVTSHQTEVINHSPVDDISRPGRRDKRSDDQTKKSPLKGYKTLEVFGETNKKGTYQSETFIDVQDEQRKYTPRFHPPVYKLDLRNYPPQGNMISMLQEQKTGRSNTSALTDFSPLSVRVMDGDVILLNIPINERSVQSTPRSNNNGTSELPTARGVIKCENDVIRST